MRERLIDIISISEDFALVIMIKTKILSSLNIGAICITSANNIWLVALE